MSAPHTLSHAIRHHGVATPHAPAILSPHAATITYAHLGAVMDAAVLSLNRLGFGRGDMLGLAVPHGPLAATAFLALMAGAGIAPFDPDTPEHDLERDLVRLRPTAVVVLPGGPPTAAGIARRHGIPVLTLTPTPSEGHAAFRLSTDTSRPPRWAGWAAPEDVAVSFRTSGTTGDPEWAPMNQALFRNRLAITGSIYNLGPADRALNILNLGATATALSQLLSAALLTGGSTYIGEVYRGEGFFAAYAAAQPTWYFGPPSVHAAILDEAERCGLRRVERPLRFVRSGGGPGMTELSPRLSALFGAPVLDVYSNQRVGQVAAMRPERSTPAGSVGLPVVFHVTIEGEDGSELPTGHIGEVVLQDPAEDPHGWFAHPGSLGLPGGRMATGDLGYLDAEGFLYLTGRLKEVIKRGGAQVLPQEVDDVLLLNPAVKQAATFAVPDPLLVEAVASAVVLQPGADAHERTLREWVAERLAAFKVPRRVLIVPAIPTSAAGKVVRRTLATAFAAELAAASAPISPPVTPLERLLLPVWEQVLRQRGLGVDDDFFARGGSSLLAGVLMARVGRAIGRELPIELVWLAPTVRRMAEAVAEGTTRVGQGLPSTVVAMRTTGERPPLFCVSATEGRVEFFALAAQVDTDVSMYTLSPPRLDDQGRTIHTVEGYAAAVLPGLRAVQPHGPYRLLGYSFGGLVAFELAQMLRAAGETVSLLGLLDTAVPSGGEARLRHRVTRFVHDLRVSRPGEHAARVRTVLTNVQRGELLRPPLRHASSSYAPRDYDGLMLLFPCEVRLPTRKAPIEHAWQRLAPHLTVAPVPGDHDGLLRDPAPLAVLARQVGCALAAADAAPTMRNR